MIEDAMELNERYSDMFELRIAAINQRYEAQKERLSRMRPEDFEEGGPKEMQAKLDQWFTAEMESMDNEKRKITKGWFTSIDAIRKIKRDLEITSEMKKGFSLKIPSKSHLKQGEDTSSLYGMLTKSVMSPSNKRQDSTGKRILMKDSPLNSPHGNSAYSQTKIISDPNLLSMKLKQGDMLSKKNEELARSIEHLDSNKNLKEKSLDNLKNQLEISDNKKSIVNEIDGGLLRYPQSDVIDMIQNTKNLKDESPFGSPPHPSVASSNLYQISPTTLKRQSKVNSHNKPRSTQKSESGMDEKSKPDDIIWIKDQQKTKFEPEKAIEKDSYKSLPSDNKNSKSETRHGKGKESFGKDLDKSPFELHSPKGSSNLLSIAGPQKPFDTKSQNNLDNFCSPSDSHKKNAKGDLSDRELEYEIEKGNPLASMSNPLHKTIQFSAGAADLEATHPPASSSGGLNSLKKELEKIPRATESSIPERSSQHEFLTRDGSKRGHGKTLNSEHEDYLNDLTQGIGFDSGIIKNDFEDTKKSAYNLDDFASMSDSDRDLNKRHDVINKLSILSDDILDAIFTETIADIINMLENENMDFEREIASGYNQQIYLQDGQDNLTVQQQGGQRKGIRVNFNAVKEYISLLINFIKGIIISSQAVLMT
jgi:hypothetical protein